MKGESVSHRAITSVFTFPTANIDKLPLQPLPKHRSNVILRDWQRGDFGIIQNEDRPRRSSVFFHIIGYSGAPLIVCTSARTSYFLLA